MITFRVSVRHILHILILVGVLICLRLLVNVWPVLLLAAVCLLLAVALMPVVEWLSGRLRNRALSAVVVVFAVLGALARLLITAWPCPRGAVDRGAPGVAPRPARIRHAVGGAGLCASAGRVSEYSGPGWCDCS